MEKNQFKLHSGHKYYQTLLWFFNTWHYPFSHKLIDITRKWSWRHFCFLYTGIAEIPESETNFETTEMIASEYNQTMYLVYHAPNGMKYSRKLVYGTGGSDKPTLVVPEILQFTPAEYLP